MGRILSPKWFRIALINLVIVALYGSLMRYKIAFDFPFLEQKKLLNAHSHFAFAGWISHVLYCGFLLLIAPFIKDRSHIKYKALIILNLVSAYGMLISFTIQGYQLVSIAFSTLSIITAVIFTVLFIRDSKNFPPQHAAKPWAVTALLLNVISAAGPFYLAYMMFSKNFDQYNYLASVYYYLHFQYSGWFFFGFIAIIANKLPISKTVLNKYYTLFAVSVIPAFFLSILWYKLPLWLYILTVAACLLQLFTWLVLMFKLWPVLNKQPIPYPRWVKIFFYAAATALTIKFVLQAVSVVPYLSHFAFSIRSIVIAFLHLILLGIYSLFIIGYLFVKKNIHTGPVAKYAAFSFLAGVVLNELVLALLGIAAFYYLSIPYSNYMLFGAAIILFASALFLWGSQVIERKKTGNP